MAPRTLAGLSTVLAAAGNVSEALNALSQDVIEHDRNGHVVLFIYDAKRDLLSERLIPAHEGMRTAQIEIAVDHLPTAVRRTLVGLEMSDRAVPRHGYPVVKDGTQLGVVTSGSFGPSVERSIALAYVDLGHAAGSDSRSYYEIKYRGPDNQVIDITASGWIGT